MITNAIRNGETKFFLIRGCGGSGKTQFAKKVNFIWNSLISFAIQYIFNCYTQIFAFTRSLQKIAKGCAATALASQVYGNLDFDTAHGLFVIPVIENEEDYDHINDIFCDTSK